MPLAALCNPYQYSQCSLYGRYPLHAFFGLRYVSATAYHEHQYFPLATAPLPSTTMTTRLTFQDLRHYSLAASRSNSGRQQLTLRLTSMTSWTLAVATSLYLHFFFSQHQHYRHRHHGTLQLLNIDPYPYLVDPSPSRLLNSTSTSILQRALPTRYSDIIIPIIAAFTWPGWHPTTGFGYSIYLSSSLWTLEDLLFFSCGLDEAGAGYLAVGLMEFAVPSTWSVRALGEGGGMDEGMVDTDKISGFDDSVFWMRRMSFFLLSSAPFTRHKSGTVQSSSYCRYLFVDDSVFWKSLTSILPPIIGLLHPRTIKQQSIQLGAGTGANRNWHQRV